MSGLSIGLSLTDILEQDIGLTLGLLNERYNQYLDSNKKEKDEEIIQGTAEMLMNM